MAKPPNKAIKVKKESCESCNFRKGDFFMESQDSKTMESITRCFCKARYSVVDVTLMSAGCDFFKIDPAVFNDRKQKEKTGI